MEGDLFRKCSSAGFLDNFKLIGKPSHQILNINSKNASNHDIFGCEDPHQVIIILLGDVSNWRLLCSANQF
jgi:hypothetical protein